MVQPMDVYAALHKNPFVPFRIVTKTGKIYEIKERDREMVGAGTMFVFVGIRADEKDDVFDRHDNVFYDTIDRLELMPVPTMGAAV